MAGLGNLAAVTEPSGRLQGEDMAKLAIHIVLIAIFTAACMHDPENAWRSQSEILIDDGVSKRPYRSRYK